MGGGGPNFLLHISSSWVNSSWHAEFQLPGRSGSWVSMVEDNKTTTKQQNNSSVLRGTLASAKSLAELG